MLTCERVLARARQGKYLGKTKTYGVIMKNQKTVKPSKTRAEAVQAKAKLSVQLLRLRQLLTMVIKV